jgi:hypothetical protein
LTKKTNTATVKPMFQSAGISESISSNTQSNTSNTYIRKIIISVGIIAALIIAQKAGV